MDIPTPPLHDDSPTITSSRTSLTTSPSCSSPSIITTGESNEIPLIEEDRRRLPEDPNRRFYEVYFTCFVGTYYTSKYTLHEGDFIIVQADRGHDIGVVNRLIEFEVSVIDENNEVISVVPKDEFPVRAMLQDKVIAQNQALEICRNKCVELLISTHIEVIATEFQFDRKKLTLYYKKYSDVSVCKLIRKLYNIFKMRIWMEPIDVELCNDSFSNITTKFLSLAQITIPPQEKTAEVLPSPPVVPKKDITTTIKADKPVSVEAPRRDLSLPQKVSNQQHHQYQNSQSTKNPPPRQVLPISPPAQSIHQNIRQGERYQSRESYSSQEQYYGHDQYQPREQYHQYQPRYQNYQSREQYHPPNSQQHRSFTTGYSYQQYPTPQQPTLHFDYERNNIRDSSFNYRDHSTVHDSSYHPYSGTLRQERIERQVEIPEDPFYQYQQKHHSFRTYANNKDGNFRPSLNSISLENEDVGRFLTNGLLDEDTLTSPFRETEYEYSNFMPQTSFENYYPNQDTLYDSELSIYGDIL